VRNNDNKYLAESKNRVGVSAMQIASRRPNRSSRAGTSVISWQMNESDIALIDIRIQNFSQHFLSVQKLI
jgi:hypothetical protein